MEDRLAEQPTVLEIYIQYDHLLAEQFATIIQGVSRAYAAIQESALGRPHAGYYPGFYRIGRPLVERLNPSGYPPLAISRVETGNSVKIGFGPAWELKIVDGDLELTVARSRATAALMLVGAALTLGLGGYSEFLNIQKSQLEVEKLRLEIAEMPPLRPDSARSVRHQVKAVRDALAYPTIRSAEINSVPVR
jgi:hypothetical protein